MNFHEKEFLLSDAGPMLESRRHCPNILLSWEGVEARPSMEPGHLVHAVKVNSSGAAAVSECSSRSCFDSVQRENAWSIPKTFVSACTHPSCRECHHNQRLLLDLAVS